MIIKTFVEPPINNNNYVIADEVSKEAALIDCSSFDLNIQNFIEGNGLVLKYILLTHGHFDHIAGIRNNDEVKVFMHEADMDWVLRANEYLPMFGVPYMTIPSIDTYVHDKDIIKLGNIDIQVIETPGHTEGGVCYLANNTLFTGDTIFKESVGRCDLPGGDIESLKDSIQNKIFTLPDEIEILPGHGKNTTIGWEKSNNKFI